MAIIGVDTSSDTLVLWKGRDFRWNFDNLDASGNLTAYPAGELFFEIQIPDAPQVMKLPFTIEGATATIKVESQVADTIPSRALWQLVFLPEGEAEGGDPIARGTVMRVGDR